MLEHVDKQLYIRFIINVHRFLYLMVYLFWNLILFMRGIMPYATWCQNDELIAADSVLVYKKQRMTEVEASF